jgi:hypothetical protein
MTDKKFTIWISSPPDREKLVAEIVFGDEEHSEQWAELNEEDGTLRIEFYPRRDMQFWQFSFDEVINALNEAKRCLTASEECLENGLNRGGGRTSGNSSEIKISGEDSCR